MSHPEQSRDEAPQAAPGPAPMPYATVTWLFERLGVRYGHFFLGKWDGINLEVVKEDWRQNLVGISDQQLEYALGHLPTGRPPSDVGEFRKLCEATPRPATKAPRLPPPRGRMELRPEIRAAVAQLLEPTPKGEEPHRVVVARRFIGKFDGAANLSLRQKEDLAHFKRVVERFERVSEERTAAAKESTQTAVDQYQQEHGNAESPSAPAEH